MKRKNLLFGTLYGVAVCGIIAFAASRTPNRESDITVDEVEALTFCEATATVKVGPLKKTIKYICNGSDGSCTKKEYVVIISCSGKIAEK